MSSRPIKQLRNIVILFGLIVGAATLTALIKNRWNVSGYWKSFNWRDDFWSALGSFFSPVPMYSQGHHLIRLMAYLLGTIIFSGVIVALLTNIIRTTGERFTNGTAQYRFKNHFVFLGFDEMMIGTIRQELDDSSRRNMRGKHNKKSDIVIAIPNKAASVRKTIYQYLSKDESDRVFVIQASRINMGDLEEVVQVHKATKVFIIGQPDEETHDANNLKCFALVASLNASKRPDFIIPCYYYLRNQSTFYLIHRLEYKIQNLKKNIEITSETYDNVILERCMKAGEPFNFHESIARHMLFGFAQKENDVLQLNPTKTDPHIVIYGMTPMGVALMRDVLMTQHFPGRRLRVTMVDENALEEMHYLIGRHRPFFENCNYSFRNLDNPSQNTNHEAVLSFLDVDMEFIQGDVAHPKLADYLRECVRKHGDSLTIAVCTNNSPKNMALALYMPRQVFEAKIPIWVYQTGDNSMNSFVENDDKGNLYSSIRVFSTINYGIVDRTRSWQWQMAKVVSDDYASKHPYDPNYKWEYSQPSGRWSSLYGAISKIPMLRSIGKGNTPILLSDDEIIHLSIAEHNRWNTEKLLNGWEPSPQGTGKTAFRHDKIVPFEQLDDKTKDKDHEQIEAVVSRMNQLGKLF